MATRPDRIVSSNPSAVSQSQSMSSGDPFRKLFLDQVENIVFREPSRESLLALLQLATPSLKSLGGDYDAQQKFGVLRAQLHPGQHPTDSAKAARLCDSAQTFYATCMASPPRKRYKQTYSPRKNSSLPDEFNAQNKWPYIRYDNPDKRNLGTLVWMPDSAGVFSYQNQILFNKRRLVAFQCMNARGAIAHGKGIESKIEMTVTLNTEPTVQTVFDFYGGTKILNGIDDIKEEILNNGPVVSTLFDPSNAFLKSNSLGMSASCRQTHLLISGWKQTSSGECWIAHSLCAQRSDYPAFSAYPSAHSLTHSSTHTSEIAIGQFGIDDACIAPANNFENFSWQCGPYFDATMNQDSNWWKSSNKDPTMTVEVDSMSDLDSIFQEMGTTIFPNPGRRGSNIYGIPNGLGPHATSASTINVTVRDKHKKAHSKKAILHSIEWDATNLKFVIRFNFTEEGDLRPTHPGAFVF